MAENRVSLEALLTELNAKLQTASLVTEYGQVCDDEGDDAYVQEYPFLVVTLLGCRAEDTIFRFFCHLLTTASGVMDYYGIRLDRRLRGVATAVVFDISRFNTISEASWTIRAAAPGAGGGSAGAAAPVRVIFDRWQRAEADRIAIRLAAEQAAAAGAQPEMFVQKSPLWLNGLGTKGKNYALQCYAELDNKDSIIADLQRLNTEKDEQQAFILAQTQDMFNRMTHNSAYKV